MKIKYLILPKVSKKLTKLGKKINKERLSDCFKLRILLFSAAILSLPFLIDLSQANQRSFPVAQDREPLQSIWVVATAYSSDFEQTDDTPCIPADGYDLCAHYHKYGEGNTVAANFLPLGAQVRMPELYGDKVFVVHDRMNKRYGYGRIDIWMPTREEAKAFGVKYLKMEYYGGSKWKVVSN